MGRSHRVKPRAGLETNGKGGPQLSYETVIWEESDGVGRLTLNRPETLNAWTAQFGGELKQVVEGEAASESVRAVLVTGAGRGFSSGADLKAGFDPAEDGMPDIRKELHELYHPVIAGIRRLPARPARSRWRSSESGCRHTRRSSGAS